MAGEEQMNDKPFDPYFWEAHKSTDLHLFTDEELKRQTIEAQVNPDFVSGLEEGLRHYPNDPLSADDDESEWLYEHELRMHPRTQVRFDWQAIAWVVAGGLVIWGVGRELMLWWVTK
jgi:hypothetical protein